MSLEAPRKGINVVIRTRPTATFAADNLAIDTERAKIAVSLRPHIEGTLDNRRSSWNFQFDDVLHNASQETVYTTVCKPIVAGVMEGVNGTIMAYGQTGAGKSFTMVGDTSNYSNRGVSPRAIADLFAAMDMRPDLDFKVAVTYLEIYNERVFDLLEDPLARVGKKGAVSHNGANHDFEIVDTRENGIVVRGLTKLAITNEEEALDLLFKGDIARTTASHQLNRRSNRSHCIYTVHVEQRSRLHGSEKSKVAKLSLVDLAGSERLKKTAASPTKQTKLGGQMPTTIDATTLRESLYINKSLTYLEQCVIALTSKSKTHVPYRQSKLTNVLKDSLGGNCRTVMIACIWVEARHLEETIQTLQLARRMLRVKNRAVANEISDPTKLVAKYERQVKELKRELMMHDALANRSGIVYADFTSEQREAAKAQIVKYLRAPPGDDADAVPPVESVHQITEFYKLFKQLVLSAESEAGEKLRSEDAVRGHSRRGTSSKTALLESRGGLASGGSAEGGLDDAVGEAVGEEEEGGSGFAVGVAPSSSRPTTVDWGTSAKEGDGDEGASGGAASPAASKIASPTAGDAPASASRGFHSKGEAYEAFKRSGEGRALVEDVGAAKGAMHEARGALVVARDALNASKDTIAELSRILAEKKDARKSSAANAAEIANAGLQSDDTIIDEEEYRFVLDLRNEKRACVFLLLRAYLSTAARYCGGAVMRSYPRANPPLSLSLSPCTSSYRALMATYTAAKADFDGATNAIVSAKRRLLSIFEDWFAAIEEGEGGELLLDAEDSFLDPGEAFERIEQARIQETAPGSLAFFNANKHMRKTMGGQTGGQLRRTIRSKRSLK